MKELSIEDKQLLLIDLYARLLYGFFIHRYSDNADIRIDDISTFGHFLECSESEDFKPYLRPMSSMTEEEKKELFHIVMHIEVDEIIKQLKNGDCGIMEGKYHFNSLLELDWLNKKGFDYRGLIEKGLALEAPEGMYNIKEK